MDSRRSTAPGRRDEPRVAAGPFQANGLAICTLLAAIVVADASTVVRIGELPIGRGNAGIANGLGNADASSGNGNTGSFNGNGNSGNFNGNGNGGNFNGNGNAGSFNGNFNSGNFNGNTNCGSGSGNGFSSSGNGNGQGAPQWCRILKSLNRELGLPPGTIPDFE